MYLHPLLRDRQAVSPVIGVGLMLAITVMLAAVVGSGVLSASQLAEPAPSLDVGYRWKDADGDMDADTVTIYHDGGDPLEPATITVQVNGTIQHVAGNWADSAGDSAYINGGDHVDVSVTPDAKVTVVWSDGERSVVLAGFTIP